MVFGECEVHSDGHIEIPDQSLTIMLMIRLPNFLRHSAFADMLSAPLAVASPMIAVRFATTIFSQPSEIPMPQPRLCVLCDVAETV
jgi:hypothetical protein